MLTPGRSREPDPSGTEGTPRPPSLRYRNRRQDDLPGYLSPCPPQRCYERMSARPSTMRVFALFAGPERLRERGQKAPCAICPQSVATKEIKERLIVIDVFRVAQH